MKRFYPTRQIKARIGEDLYEEVHRLLEDPVASANGDPRKKYGELSGLIEHLLREWVENQRKPDVGEG